MNGKYYIYGLNEIKEKKSIPIISFELSSELEFNVPPALGSYKDGTSV